MGAPDRIRLRALGVDAASRIGEIDRTERIDAIFVQHGQQLDRIEGSFSAQPWFPHGTGEHSVAAQSEFITSLVGRGATAVGAFVDEQLVGIGIVLPGLRPGIAQLAYLHVTDGHRDRGIGRQLCETLERIAREAGAREIVVSATPSVHTVRFYLALGYRPMARPLPELLELEPDDVHLAKPLAT